MWSPMAMMMPRNRYISDSVVLYHLYLVLGGFCCAYTFVFSTNISIISFPNVILKKSHAVAVLGITMAGPTGSLNEVKFAGSVREPSVQEVTRELRVDPVALSLVEMLVDSLFVSCKLSELSSDSSACWGVSSEGIHSE